MRAQAAIAVSCFSVLSLVCAVPRGQAQAAPISTAKPAAILQDSTNELFVGVGKTVLVDTAQPVSRVAVGLGEVAEATAVSPTEIMINGKAAGETSLIIWDIRGGRQFFNVSVRPSASAESDHLASIRRELRAEMPAQNVTVSMENGNVFLRGTVKDLTQSDRAVKIAATVGKVVNLLDVQVPASDPQILIKVRFASVDRSLEKQLGINIFSSGFNNVLGGVTTGQFSPPTVTSSATGGNTVNVSNELNLMAFLPGTGLGATLQALQTKGLVQLLAEPNLLTANGKQASFLAGGEFPFPVVQGSASGGSSVTIMFKEYGIRLNFIPTITPRGTIRLQVAPEVSSLDYTNEAHISGFQVPGITTRKVNTEVELSDSQSFVIGGLLDNSETQSFQKIPFLGDVPILGKFFQSMTRTKNNTELIVIVTPEIVAPIPAGTALPTPSYPVPFLPPNSNIPMHTPDAKTDANTPKPAPATLPVETLQESMKPEKPLVIEGVSGTFGAASTASTSGGAAATPASPQQ